MTDCKLE